MNNLFDINGSYGGGAYALPEYKSINDLIEKMNYLGISRSLVFHMDSRDFSPLIGNRKILYEIENCKEAVSRLIPVFSVTPADLYEPPTLDFVIDSLKSGKVRAIRLFPATAKFYVREIEPVLQKIKDFKPVVLCDISETRNPQDSRDIIEMANRFSSISFIYTGVYWPDFNLALDMLRRAENKNIFLDISILHMRNAIEMLVRNFGAGRVLFGSGPKAQYGASIASLARADISERDRKMIAGENISALLGLPPTPSFDDALYPDIVSKKPLWMKFRAGKDLDNIKIIDGHTHTGPLTRGWVCGDIDLDDNIQALIREMDRNCVTQIVTCPEVAQFSNSLEGNRAVEKALEPYYDRFKGYLVFNPRYADLLIPELDNFFSRKFFIGFKILPAYWRVGVDDPLYVPMWEYADRYALPILIHTWEGFGAPAEMLRPVAEKYPGAQLIFGHSGGGDKGRLETEKLALEFSNVIPEFCGSFTAKRSWADTLKAIGNGRFIFGSDTGAHGIAWELGRFLSTPVPDETLLPGLSANYEKILSKIKLKKKI